MRHDGRRATEDVPKNWYRTASIAAPASGASGSQQQVGVERGCHRSIVCIEQSCFKRAV
jgi:hypothetical protein